MCANNFCAILVAVYSLLQSGGCIILGTLAILLSECILHPAVPEDYNDAGGYFLLNFFRQFFYTQNKCNATGYHVFPEYNMSIVVNPQQTEGWMTGYLIDNSLFFIGSLSLLGGLIVKKRWMVNFYLSTLSSVILYDITLMVVFGIDISFATDLKNNSTFFAPPGVPNIPGGITVGPDTKTTILVNSIAMLVYFSRFVIFFILNVVCYFFTLSTAKKLSKPKTRVGPNIPLSRLYYPEQPGLQPQQQQKQQYPHPYPLSVQVPVPSTHRSAYQGQVAEEVPPPPYNGPPRSYDNYALSSEAEHRNRLTESGVPRIPVLAREPRNMELELQRNQSPLNHPAPYRVPEVDYLDNRRRQDLPPPNEPRQKDPLVARSNSPLNTSMDSIKEVPRPRPRRTSNSSVSSETVAPELKGQLPWSYVRPGQIPPPGSNKLRDFYMNKQRSGHLSSLAEPQESDEDLDANSKVPYRKYRLKRSAERKPYLETSFSYEALPMYSSAGKAESKEPNSEPRSKAKSLSASADQLCTDEFVVLNYKSRRDRVPSRNAEDLTQTENTQSMIFEPETQTIRLNYPNDEPKAGVNFCRREGLMTFHVPSCDGLGCFSDTPGETVV